MLCEWKVQNCLGAVTSCLVDTFRSHMCRYTEKEKKRYKLTAIDILHYV